MRSLLVRTVVLPLVILGCGGDKATGPTTGDVVLNVAGLPPGSAADILVTGPGGFSAVVLTTDTLSALVPGDYVVEARRITFAGDDYAAAQSRQTIAVRASKAAISSSVVYDIATGRMSISVNGLPGSAGEAIVVTGPNQFTRTITGSAQLTRLVPGTYTVTAGAVNNGMQVYLPDQASRTVQVPASKTPAGVSLAFTPSTGLNLSIEAMHITQSVQRLDGSIPLIRGRDGYLRIFGRANVENGAVVPVRVSFYLNGVLQNTVTLPAGASAVPHALDPGSLGRSWNMPIAGSLIQPGLTIRAEIDPDNSIAEVLENDNVFPAKPLNIVDAPVFAVRFVPIHSDSTGLTGNVSEANKHQYLTVAQKLHPIPGYDADVRATYTTTLPALTAAAPTWSALLSEINALRITEGSGRYYYGVVGTTYNSGVAGIGYVPGRTALGWDKFPSAAGVLAHEIGHNWGRLHSPCGGVGNPDPSYPHPGGLIGHFGFDLTTGIVQNPATQSDIMGYCNNQWISDYTYMAVLNHRATQSATGSATSQSEAVVVGETQPALLVWGRIVDGKVILEPAFEVVTRSAVPSRGGPYTIEGTDASGARLFSISFSGEEVADSERGERQFAFAVPMSADRSGRLTTVRAVGQGGGAEQRTGLQSSGDAAVTAKAQAGGRVRVRWNEKTHPMMLIRDAQTGQVLSFARGGDVTVKTNDREVELSVSEGARSDTRLVQVEPR